eukprot:1273227-Pleurochrysis_carterae.AAC.1
MNAARKKGRNLPRVQPFRTLDALFAARLTHRRLQNLQSANPSRPPRPLPKSRKRLILRCRIGESTHPALPKQGRGRPFSRLAKKLGLGGSALLRVERLRRRSGSRDGPWARARAE